MINHHVVFLCHKTKNHVNQLNTHGVIKINIQPNMEPPSLFPAVKNK